MLIIQLQAWGTSIKALLTSNKVAMRQIIDFLSELKAHNERDWFNANKEKFLIAKTSFEEFVLDLISELQLMDPTITGATPKNTIYRIYRDVRFSTDKSPYKTHFGAYIARGGRKSPLPGYYIHIDPDESFLGGGIFQPGPEQLKAIRKEIFDFPEDIDSIMGHDDFGKSFVLFDRDKLKRPPQGFSADFSHIDFLKYKHFVVSQTFPIDWVNKSDFSLKVINQFHRILPFNLFLKRAIDSVDD